MSGRAPGGLELRYRRALAAIGRSVRARTAFVLMLFALFWGVLREALRPRSWRRTVRTEFWRALHQAVGGGLATAIVTGSLTGVALVSQALYWLGLAGQEELEGPLVVTVLVRELTPLLIGILLLGRSGTVILIELDALQQTGRVRVLGAMGIDPFLLLVLPRTAAFALASFTLGVTFVSVALVVGFVVGSLLGTVQISLWMFLDHVLTAMRAIDFAVFPVKMLSIGSLLALTMCLSGLTADPGDGSARLLPLGFVRGVLVVMLTSVIFSLAA